MSSEFDAYLESTRSRVNRALTGVLDDYLRDVDEWLRAPIRYACEGGGKRFRPVLFLASYEVCAGTPGVVADRLATALEIVHSYSLVHDDLPCMDDDDWRRGRPTCHRAFGVDRAAGAAAAMVPLAGWVMAQESRSLGLTSAEAATLVAELSRAAGPVGMVGGQYLDLESEGRPVSRERLQEIHGRKTGALIQAAARLGSRAARAPGEVVSALSAYGDRLGLAFQIADDLLDEAKGRGTGRGDRILEKATYVRVLGRERAREEARCLARAAVEGLSRAGLRTSRLESLAIHVVERDR